MNIFFLSECPTKSAELYIDKHVGKIILEIAQCLSTAVYHTTGSTPTGVYRPSYDKHPINIWLRQSRGNVDWVLDHVEALEIEGQCRGRKPHKSFPVCQLAAELLQVPDLGLTLIPSCMPEEFYGNQKWNDLETTIKNYRRFYRSDKLKMTTAKDFARDPNHFIFQTNKL